MLLVGGLTTAVSAFWLGWRQDAKTLSRLGFWSLLAVAFPAWWLMRIAAQWIYDKEGFDEDPGWIGIGYTTAEGGGLALIASSSRASACAGSGAPTTEPRAPWCGSAPCWRRSSSRPTWSRSGR